MIITKVSWVIFCLHFDLCDYMIDVILNHGYGEVEVEIEVKVEVEDSYCDLNHAHHKIKRITVQTKNDLQKTEILLQ